MGIPADTSLLINDIASRVKSGEIRQVTVAAATGIDQSQVSRILAGKSRRVSRNVEALCKYAKTLETPTSAQEDRKQALTDKLLKIWDGTTPHAEALEQLFLSIDQIQQLAKIDT